MNNSTTYRDVLICKCGATIHYEWPALGGVSAVDVYPLKCNHCGEVNSVSLGGAPTILSIEPPIKNQQQNWTNLT